MQKELWEYIFDNKRKPNQIPEGLYITNNANPELPIVEIREHLMDLINDIRLKVYTDGYGFIHKVYEDGYDHIHSFPFVVEDDDLTEMSGYLGSLLDEESTRYMPEHIRACIEKVYNAIIAKM